MDNCVAVDDTSEKLGSIDDIKEDKLKGAELLDEETSSKFDKLEEELPTRFIELDESVLGSVRVGETSLLVGTEVLRLGDKTGIVDKPGEETEEEIASKDFVSDAAVGGGEKRLVLEYCKLVDIIATEVEDTVSKDCVLDIVS